MMIKEMIIYWSEEAQGFMVEVPELPGCMAAGPTCERALKNAGRIIAEWSEMIQEPGPPMPQPKGRLMYA